jgi:hypothetical protein
MEFSLVFKFLVFANLKMFRVIDYRHDCLLFQSDIKSVNDRRAVNSTRLIHNVNKMSVILYS